MVVSVVIPTRNRPQMLRETVDSILAGRPAARRDRRRRPEHSDRRALPDAERASTSCIYGWRRSGSAARATRRSPPRATTCSCSPMTTCSSSPTGSAASSRRCARTTPRTAVTGAVLSGVDATSTSRPSPGGPRPRSFSGRPFCRPAGSEQHGAAAPRHSTRSACSTSGWAPARLRQRRGLRLRLPAARGRLRDRVRPRRCALPPRRTPRPRSRARSTGPTAAARARSTPST